MTSVFISYSRTDQAFVRRLHSALAAAGRDAWVDWEDIPPSAQWHSEIESGIAAADTIICVISPDWVASATSQQEVATALADRKRIIPLVYREVPSAEVDAGVRALNWIFFRESDDFDAAFQKLLFAMDTDLDYWHLSSRLLVRARQWESGKENTSFVLRGKELAESERWLSEGADKQPTPTALQTRFVTASRRASGRRQSTWISLLSAGLIIALVLATYARIEQGLADQRNELLFSQVLAGDASADLTKNQVDQALLLGVAATRRLPDTFQARNALLDALEYSPHLAATFAGNVPGAPSAGQGVAVAFSADSHTLMFATQGDPPQDGTVTLWDVAAHHARRQIDIKKGLIVDAALSPDGSLVAVNDAFNGLTLWDAQTGTPRFTLAPTTALHADNSLNPAFYDVAAPGMVFTHDGTLLAARQCDDAQCAHPFIGLWNPATGKSVGQLPLDFPPEFVSLAVSRNDQRLAAVECAIQSGSAICQIDMFDVAAQKRLFTQPIVPAVDGGYNTLDVRFAPDGSTLFTSGCADADCNLEQLLQWDAATGARVGTAWNLGRGSDQRFAFSPNGQTLVTTRASGALTLWNVADRQPIDDTLVGHTEIINDLAFSPDGRYFASAGEDGKILLWRAASFSNFSLARGPDLDGSSQVAISPDGATLATANCDGVVRLWDRTTGSVRARLSVPEATFGFCMPSLAFSHDGRLLAAGTAGGPLIVWNAITSELVTLCANCPTGFVKSVAFSPDGSDVVASAQTDTGSTIVLMNATSGTVVATFPVRQVATEAGAAFSPDGTVLALGGGGNDLNGIALWDLKQSRQIALLTGHTAVVGALAFNATGSILASLDGNGHTMLWDVKTHQRLAVLGDTQSSSENLNLAFSPDGQMLAVSSHNRITLWDIHDVRHPALYVRPTEETDIVLSLAFSPDGQFLVDAVNNGPVNVRYVTLAGWQQQACAIAGRNFTHAEWATFTTTQNEPYPTVCPALPVPKT